MKSLRKSLNGNKDSNRPQISTPLPLPPVSKPPTAILPPQKVIRALSGYRSKAPQELSFQKGDFFYVLKDADPAGGWYEAHNPVTGARGLVPRAMFEEFGKNAGPQSIRASTASSKSPQMGYTAPTRPVTSPAAPKTQVFYAIVLHDFLAERADELDAKRGDAITVVAQSNREWFVAKPIGRLGRPGLIPVSFVEIHDPATGKPIPDVEGLMDRGELPKVEDWKRAMLSYKQNSISLGVIDAPARGPVPNSPYMPPPPAPQPSQGRSEPPPPSEIPEPLPEGVLLSANVVSFHYEMDEYWFRIDALYQPYNRPGQIKLPPSKQLILFRVYDDFYDFQVSLLENFPREAGRQPPEPRTLPYMPGPAADVDDALTATRRLELDEYIQSLCSLNKTGGRYILEHLVIRKFLALKPGDVEHDSEPRTREIEELSADNPDDYGLDDEEVRDRMGRMRLQDEGGGSDGSDYGDDGFKPQGKVDRHPYAQAQPINQRNADDKLRYQAHAQNHQRSASSASYNNQPQSSYASNSRSQSPYPTRTASPQPRNGDYSGGQSRWDEGGGVRTSQASSGGRSRSQSNATNLNTPPISAANPQTAFVKIKIFDRVADDLIAIRVHPKVSHTELMNKVQSRLGGDVVTLRYRDSMTNTFVGLDSDDELRGWMEGTDKHVLYAD